MDAGAAAWVSLQVCPVDGGSPLYVDTSNDPLHCGACDNVCDQGSLQGCRLGTCAPPQSAGGLACGAPIQSCSGAPVPDGGCAGGTTLCQASCCTDLQTDSCNCGQCGAACGIGAVCASGSCAPICPGGQALASNILDRGACYPVPAPATLTAGPFSTAVTLCPASTPSSSPVLTDLEDDPRNCGACGHACAGEQLSLGGSCGWGCGGSFLLSPCHGTLPDGGCGGGETLCPSNGPGECVCTDLRSDPMNCGACGQRCPSGVCQAGQCTQGCFGGQLCEYPEGLGPGYLTSGPSLDFMGLGGLGGIQGFAGAGICVWSCQSFHGLAATQCGTGPAAFCTSTQVDPQNCGACGHACASGQLCADGACATDCDTVFPGQTPAPGGFAPACPEGDVCDMLFPACVPALQSGCSPG